MRSTFNTLSEVHFEHWCQGQSLECRRIREAATPGHKRPDYAIRVQQNWCIVEVKQLEPTPDDNALLRQLKSGTAGLRWLDPGARLRRPIRDASAQLKRFSLRGFPTVVCFFDATIGFYLERYHVEQAMFGQRTLHFEVSSDPQHQPRFLGERFGKKATLTSGANTSISAVAVLRQPQATEFVIDLYHNPNARVPIPHGLCRSVVRKQHCEGIEDRDMKERSVFDLLQSAEWQEWLDDPDGKFEREIEKCFKEFST